MNAVAPFDHHTLGQRILFGSGRASHHLRLAVDEAGAASPMVIAGSSDRAIADAVLADLPYAVRFDEVRPHVPSELAERARVVARKAGADLLVSIGGGSTTGLAKAVALTTGLPIVAVPTTYAGSEATNVWGLTEAARKTTGQDNRVVPSVVVYDAELTRTLPRELSIASACNALAHCIDSLWAPRADPITTALATEAMTALVRALPDLAEHPDSLAGRERALYGAYLAAVVFAGAGSGLHHKICHVLGGRFDLPHAQTHAVVLPYVLAFNARCAPAAVSRIADALNTSDPVSGLRDLLESVGAPHALQTLGMPQEGVTESTDLILPLVPESNPRSVTRHDLAELLDSAWSGKSPS
ncbi:Maleylacetate reductase [Rhodococcus ruber]|uniref:maleylacetate reductase n=1 Tax=Rhodococcus ruber TaxID=1830 RepID=UPI00315DDFD1